MEQSEQTRSRAERMALLTQTSPGSEMGRLLRRFWHPIARSDRVAPRKAKPLRYFGEDLTLYRGESGRVFLVGGLCAHRLTQLHTGWVEGDEIRCMYHGWKYDGSGQCTETPAEKDGLHRSVRIKGYPVHEYAGLIFAYLGDGPAPEFSLPRKDVLEAPDRMLFQREQVWPCNWFQQIENSMDAVHVSFTHMKGVVGTFGEAVTPAIPELAYSETAAGIRQVATRGPNNVRCSDWTFPNNNHIIVPGLSLGETWIDVVVWMVPNDDGHTTRFEIYAVPSTDEVTDRRITGHFAEASDYDAADHHDELFCEERYPEEVLMQLTSAQDYVAQVGQGVVVDRTAERLGKSDEGIVFMRRIFWRELDLMRTGGRPKDWLRLDEPAQLPIQMPKAAKS